MRMRKPGLTNVLSQLRVAVALLALAPLSVVAVGPVDWVGADGNWEDGPNWSSGSAPGVADDVTIAGAVAVTSNGPANEAKSLGNAANLNVLSGSLDIFSVLNNEGSVAITGGRLESDSLINEGPGDVHVSGIASELSVLINLDNYGSVTVSQSATANIGNTTNFLMLAIDTGASVASETLATGIDGETFINDSGTEVSILGDITNFGLFSVGGGASIASESITTSGMFVVDSSIVEANSMINSISGDVTLTGSATNFQINGNITNNGTFTLKSNAQASVLSIDSNNVLELSGGAMLTTESIGNITTGDIYVHEAGSRLVLTDNLENDGSVRLASNAELEASSISTGGSLTVSGESTLTTASITNKATGSVVIEGLSTSVNLDNNFQNAGTVTISDNAAVVTGSVVNTGDIELGSQAGLSTATFINRAAGNTTISGAGTNLMVSGVFENRGVFHIDSGASATTGHYGQFDGKTSLDDGTLNATIGGINIVDGVLEGVGSFGGDLRLFANAQAAPGTVASPTTNWDIDGNVILGGTLLIDIGSGAFDTLTSSGISELGGVLDVTLLDGYAPAIGTTFDIILAASVLGDFAQEILPVFDGRTFEVIFGGDFVRLAVTAVPIPAAVYLLIPPLALVCRRRRASSQRQ